MKPAAQLTRLTRMCSLNMALTTQRRHRRNNVVKILDIIARWLAVAALALIAYSVAL